MYKHIISIPVRVARQPGYLKHGNNIRLLQTSSNHYKKNDGEEPSGRSGGRGFYKALGAVIIGTGSVVAYAKFDDDFRAWLKDNVPGSNEFISFVTAEESSHSDYIMGALSNSTKMVTDQVAGVVNSIVGSDKDEAPKEDKSKKLKPIVPTSVQEEKLHTPVKALEKPAKKPEEGKKILSEEKRKEPGERIKVEDPPKKKTEDKKPISSSKSSRDIYAIEKEIERQVKGAIGAYKEAISFLKEYSGDVNDLVESSVEKQTPQIWTELRRKTAKKEEKLKYLMDVAHKAESQLNKLVKELKDPATLGAPAQKLSIQVKTENLMNDLTAVKDELDGEKNMASVTNTYWTLVQQAREHFQDELSALFPNFSITNKQMKLAEAEMDLFTLYAFQTILYYQKELTKLDTVGQAKLKAALDKNQKGDPTTIRTAIDQEVEKEKRKIAAEYQKKLLNLKADCETKAKEAIKSHNMMHSEMLQDALALKEEEVAKKMKRQMDDQLLLEKEKYRGEMATLLGRLKGMDDVMKKRATQEKRTVQAQLLWSACEGLVSAITSDKDCNAITMKSLGPEIRAIKLAAPKDDELVQAVIAAIPQAAYDRGIFGEPALRERFANTSRVAKRVALLPEGGSSLPVMLISYLQSLLVITPTAPVPTNELNNEPINPQSLNTFEILQRSKYFADRGDWYQVLRYMNLLKGASRVVAQDFLDEVKIFLETKQAADVLISHASSSSLAK